MESMTLPRSAPADSPPLGSQSPRIWHVPEYVTSAGLEVVELAALAGLVLDPWESTVLMGACGERADGKWSAFQVGLVVPRQNGKGSIEEARELAGLFLFGENLIIHSAHEQKTATEHFRRLLQLIETVPEFDRRVLRAPRGKGAEAIELKGGQRIFFQTRTGGAGRGLTGDLVVFDEAMILPAATTSALVPTMAARSMHGNPQLWYAGSAVDQQSQEHGVVLSRVRARGIAGASNVAYFEWSVAGDDPDDVLDEIRESPESWAQANPGMGIRISAEHISNECSGALGPREFAVERLGIGDWPDPDGSGAQIIGAEAWAALTDKASTLVGQKCFAVDVTPDRSMAAIGVAGYRADGLPHVEIVEHAAGTSWVAPRLAELVQSHDCLPPVCDGSGPVASLLPELQALGVAVTTLKANEHARACGLIFDSVKQEALRHLGTQELRAAVKGAATRPLGDAWAWSRKSSNVDICPLVTVTLALWGIVDGGSTAGGFEWD